MMCYDLANNELMVDNVAYQILWRLWYFVYGRLHVRVQPRIMVMYIFKNVNNSLYLLIVFYNSLRGLGHREDQPWSCQSILYPLTLLLYYCRTNEKALSRLRDDSWMTPAG